jgi:hypothetical protein
LCSAVLIAGGSCYLAVELVQADYNLTYDDCGYLATGLGMTKYARGRGLTAPLWFAWSALHVGGRPPLLHIWIGLVCSAIGERHLGAVILLSTVLPFALVGAVVARVGSRLFGPVAGFFAVVALFASPWILLLGSRVYVETLLGGFLVWSLYRLAIMAVQPGWWTGALAGAGLALAAMTKLTGLVFLFAPCLYTAVVMLRRPGGGRSAAKALLGAGLVALVIAGPWYARNFASALTHARYSSRFNEYAGNPTVVPLAEGLTSLVTDVSGLCSAGAVLVLLAGATARRYWGPPSQALAAPAEPLASHFLWGALLTSVTAAGLFLTLSYYETRFVAPVWPTLAVCLAGAVRPIGGRLGFARGAALALIVAGVFVSEWTFRATLAENPWATDWACARLLEDLPGDARPLQVGLVGDAPEWNIWKVNLLNETTSRPGDRKFTNLSRETEASLPTAAANCDVLIVFRRDLIPVANLASSPTFNRTYSSLDRYLSDPKCPFRLADLRSPADDNRYTLYRR